MLRFYFECMFSMCLFSMCLFSCSTLLPGLGHSQLPVHTDVHGPSGVPPRQPPGIHAVRSEAAHAGGGQCATQGVEVDVAG